ncbi:YciI family protein [Agromyces lapidis]|uniref:YciI family protein n=1 Tax=Agromyces lapidis TaxID=279574 RepID=A0ABV5SK57_9MICO|nr:YciI family protein [Agromyces lapidis]
MTQYFLTMPHDSAEEPTMESMQAFDPAEFEAVIAAVGAFNTALKDSGAWLFAGGLNPPSTAKTVDASGGDVRVRDEPFVEASSYVGGFWVIEAVDEAAAVEWAAQASTALGSRIEVRALQEAPA